MQNNWYRKEKPLLSMMGMGGGNAARLTAGGLAPLEITGASVTTYSDSTHTWIVQTASNPITVSRGFDAVDEVEILLVGGGGAGSSGLSGASGGGGAGGVVVVPKTKGPEIITAPGTYPITIGSGGTYGAFGGSPSNGGGNSQITSVATPLLARGGGVGGSGTGGSGGGGNYNGNGGPGRQPTDNPGVSGINQGGNPGRKGSNPSEPYQAGGGGGAGSGGPPTSHSTAAGDGLNLAPLVPGFMRPGGFPTPIINDLGGYSAPSPHYQYFGGGGGGGGRGMGGLSSGGLGGGGGGGSAPGPAGTAGVNGRGGGGGGGAENGGQSNGAAGGSGCFVLRFKPL